MEPETADVASDLQDLSDMPLADVAKTLTDDDAAETVRRVVPADGSRLLVAASFNSAI